MTKKETKKKERNKLFIRKIIIGILTVIIIAIVGGLLYFNNLSTAKKELAAYLFKGITDKRNAVEDLFESKIDNKKANVQYSRFCQIIDRIKVFQAIKPINQTRYKQRNDFYTLFCFIDIHIEDPIEVQMEQFKVLVFISNNGLISPSNDEYDLFKEYAINCVSQSNSKRAREQRLLFFEALLANQSKDPSEEQLQLMRFANNELHTDLFIEKQGKYLLVKIDN